MSLFASPEADCADPGLSEPAGTPAAASGPARSAEDGAALDRTLFGRILALAQAEATAAEPPTTVLGLDRAALARLVARHGPEDGALLDSVPAGTGPGPEAIEEPDLRAYLLECRAGAAATAEEESWLAAIVARRCQRPNHLWQDMGLADRGELNALFRRHFPELVRRNSRDMKWKKFFYRELCQREGVPLCKSPVCDICSDFQHCFGGEEGEPLQRLAILVRPIV